MSQWYLSKNGQALGPLEESKLIALIEAGDVTPIDLVYQSGASEWLPVSEVSRFAEYFNKSGDEPVPEGDGEKDWVLLKKNQSEKGKEYKQLGPFSADQVFKMIDSGDIRFTDFAWKQGMETWAKIAEIDEFAQPLPSSPPVDTQIYEKTNVDFDASTVTDAEKKASLTHLVSIEHFDHEKTRVMPAQSSQENPSQTSISDEKTPPPIDEEDLYSEVSKVTPIPLNEESFVTETGERIAENDDSNISLWSLEPPTTKNIKNDEIEATVVASASRSESKNSKSTRKPKPILKKKPKKKNVVKEPFDNPLNKVSSEVWLWVAAVSAVTFAGIFFYMSFQVSGDDVVYDKSSQLHRDLYPENESSKAYQNEEIPNKMTAYKQAIQEARARKQATQRLDQSRLPIEVAKKVKPVPASPPPPPGPKVPLKEKRQPNEKIVTKTSKAVNTDPVVKKTTTVAKKSPEVPKPKVSVKKKPEPKNVKAAVSSQRQVATKKKVLQKRASIMKSSKKKPVKPKKTVRAPKSSSKPSTQSVPVAVGGRKAQSFYKQRDSMALFYTSIRAETLAVEISNQYKKIGSNRSAWSRYYRQWRKKVAAALANDIRQFPKRKEMYAYPKILASFKKDYNLFFKYGESFDAKVKGARAPSGVPSEMKSVFTRYKKQAQSLGR